VKIGAADSASERFHQYFARTEFGNRNVIDDDFFISHHGSTHDKSSSGDGGAQNSSHRMIGNITPPREILKREA
jgi:hypothetical protein